MCIEWPLTMTNVLQSIYFAEFICWWGRFSRITGWGEGKTESNIQCTHVWYFCVCHQMGFRSTLWKDKFLRLEESLSVWLDCCLNFLNHMVMAMKSKTFNFGWGSMIHLYVKEMVWYQCFPGYLHLFSRFQWRASSLLIRENFYLGKFLLKSPKTKLCSKVAIKSRIIIILLFYFSIFPSRVLWILTLWEAIYKKHGIKPTDSL